MDSLIEPRNGNAVVWKMKVCQESGHGKIGILNASTKGSYNLTFYQCELLKTFTTSLPACLPVVIWLELKTGVLLRKSYMPV